MTSVAKPVRRISGIHPGDIPFNDLFAAQEPMILEGIVREWPLVQAGITSDRAAFEYLTQFAAERKVTVFHTLGNCGRRFHYDENLTGLNFTASNAGLRDTLIEILAKAEEGSSDALYIGSTDLEAYFPGFRTTNDLPLDHADFRRGRVLASIWVGNVTTVPAHFDMSNNLACCMVGRRRFTLFPPEQVANLYPGPLEPTPAGQVVSMVDFNAPDFETFPRFADALSAARVADLEPGDVLYYPALWWHQVEALGGFNAMVNYWWNPVPEFVDTPETTLLHAMLSLRDRPDSEKAAWKALFDYYIFGPSEHPVAHLPLPAHGSLGRLDDVSARRLRAKILNRLNR